MLIKLDISNPKSFVKDKFGKDGVCLSNYFVSTTIVEGTLCFLFPFVYSLIVIPELEMLAADAVAEKTFVDSSANLRVPLSQKDLFELLQEIPSMKHDTALPKV